MERKKWNHTTYVIQNVGDMGQWYDFATLNTNPLEIKHLDLQKYCQELMPDDKCWRLLKRVAEETLEGGNFADFEFEESSFVEVIDSTAITFGRKGFIVSMDEFILKPRDGKIQIQFDESWTGWYRPEQIKKVIS